MGIPIPEKMVLILKWAPDHNLNSSLPSAASMRRWTVITGSDNGLSPVCRQAITWTNAGLLSIGLLETSLLKWNLNQNFIIFIQENAFQNDVCQHGGLFVQGEMS